MNIIYILIPLTLLIYILVFGILYYNLRTIKYYKCILKPHSNLLYSVLNKNRFVRDDKNFDLYMTCGYNDAENELEEMDVPRSKYIFALKGCDDIVSKNNLWFILEKTYGRSGASKLMPESYLIEDINQFNMAINRLKNKEILICKKNLQRKLGLKFAFRPRDLVEAKADEFMVAQIFLKNAKMIKNRKLNLRVYYAIKKVNDKIEFFVNANGKVLYTKEKTNGEVKFESHITSYQMDSELYEKENLPHNFKELKQFWGEYEFNRIWMKILFKIKFLSSAIAPVFDNNKFKDKVCFQLFGMDVIIDGDEPFILEINKGPDMIPKCKKDKPLKEAIYEEIFNLSGILPRPFKKNNFELIYSTYFN